MLTRPANDKVASIMLTTPATDADSTGYIDTLGYNYLTVNVHLDTAAATSNKCSTLKLSEADVTTVSSTSAIVAFTGGTATSTSVGFVIAAADTSNAKIYRMNCDLRGRKRYIFATVRFAGAGAITSIIGNLSAAVESPDTAAEAGSVVLISD